MIDDSFTPSLRAKLHASQVDSGQSYSALAEQLGLENGEQLREYFNGAQDMKVAFLHRYAQLVGRPIWWFFGEQPATVTIEAAETAVANVSRMRLYLDAIETEFRQVLGASPTTLPPSSKQDSPAAFNDGAVVVDFAPYLSRARAILEREAEVTEDSEEVFEESVEMIAHSLYSIEMAVAPSREN